jgi:hypothetical protein
MMKRTQAEFLRRALYNKIPGERSVELPFERTEDGTT